MSDVQRCRTCDELMNWWPSIQGVKESGWRCVNEDDPLHRIGRMDDIEKALTDLASYAAESKRCNTPEFMEGLVEELNKAAVALGDAHRFFIVGDGIRMKPLPLAEVR